MSTKIMRASWSFLPDTIEELRAQLELLKQPQNWNPRLCFTNSFYNAILTL